MPAGPPASVRIPRDLTGLDFDDEEPALGMGQDDVRLAVAEPAMVRGPADPVDVGVEPVFRREGDAQPLEDEALCLFACGLFTWSIGSGRRRHPALSRSGGWTMRPSLALYAWLKAGSGVKPSIG